MRNCRRAAKKQVLGRQNEGYGKGKDRREHPMRIANSEVRRWLLAAGVSLSTALLVVVVFFCLGNPWNGDTQLPGWTSPDNGEKESFIRAGWSGRTSALASRGSF